MEGRRFAFGWTTQPLPSFGPVVEDGERVATALGLEPGALARGWPVEVVSCCVPYLFVPLESRAYVDAVALDRRALIRSLRAAGRAEVPVYVFTLAQL